MIAVRLFAVLALVACASRTDAKSNPGADSAHGAVASSGAASADSTTGASPAVITAPPGAVAPADTGAAADTGAKADSSRRDSTKTKTAATTAAPKPAFTVEAAPGALLPGHRIVAFYGNPKSTRMGILGQIPKDQMLAQLAQEAKGWAAADPKTPVIPALHLIVTVAQGDPGKDGMYRLRHPDTLIKTVKAWADAKNYLMFLDIQVGLSTVQNEIPHLLPFLKDPRTHLALDPEFSMKDGTKPGRKIGTMTAADVNYAIQQLDQLVTQNHLPPKILVVHRFTQKMLTDYRSIRPTPNVQVVIDMDGFGPTWLKRDSYKAYVRDQPVQFTGFKLFYKNDKPMLTKKQVVDLDPSPLYIQYQ